MQTHHHRRTMTDHKQHMLTALKAVFIPALRQRGFKGSLPHFYRNTPARADFVSIQFYSAGGSFVVEIACCPPDGPAAGPGKGLPIARLNTTYFGTGRIRLTQEGNGQTGEQWFSFGPRSYEPDQPIQPPAHYEAVAASLLPLLDTQAENWWASHQETHAR